MDVVETMGLVSPPPRPSLAATEEGQATGREDRSFSSNTSPGCLTPTPYVIIWSLRKMRSD